MPSPRSQFPARGRGLRAGARRRLQLLAANARLARALEQAQDGHRAKSAFVAGLSHQLRNPLTSILLGSEMLAEDLGKLGQADLTRDAERINEAGRLLLAMLDDLLDLTRLEAGRMQFNRVETDPVALAAQVVQACLPLARSNNNALLASVVGAPAPLVTDPDKLGQILFHLVNNGLKFSRGGTVTVEVGGDGPARWFTVRDTGIGMNTDQVDRIRQDFARPIESQPRTFGIAGLGLTLCNVLSRGLGGSLQIDQPLDGGIAFTLRLTSA